MKPSEETIAKMERLSAIRRELMRSGKIIFETGLMYEAQELDRQIKEAHRAVEMIKNDMCMIGNYKGSLSLIKPKRGLFQLLKEIWNGE